MSAVDVEASAGSARKDKLYNALATTRKDAAYLISPKDSPAPASRRTRVLLRSLRYIFVFAFWRLVRYAKYAAAGALTAALAGTALGTVTGGVGFILAPPGILAGAGVGLIWAVAKFGWRTAASRIRSGDTEVSAREDERDGDVKVDKYPAERVMRETNPF